MKFRLCNQLCKLGGTCKTHLL